AAPRAHASQQDGQLRGHGRGRADGRGRDRRRDLHDARRPRGARLPHHGWRAAMSLRIVCCVEAGRLEGETLLLCASLRRFGGALSGIPVTPYPPRAGGELDPSARSGLAVLEVEPIEEGVNTEHAFHPIANKLYAAADAERRYEEASIAVVDSDAVFVAEPDALELPEATDAAASPVGKVSEGTTGKGHRNEAYWQELYQEFG